MNYEDPPRVYLSLCSFFPFRSRYFPQQFLRSLLLTTFRIVQISAVDTVS